jgi:CheY-like chemotaxis protein
MRSIPHRIKARIRNVFRGKYVLWLVDDEHRWHEYIKTAYSTHPRFDVRCFHFPKEALQALDEGRRPDLVLLDVFFTSDSTELSFHNMSKSLDTLAEQADSIWQEYQHLYRPEGLDFARTLYKAGVPYCLY